MAANRTGIALLLALVAAVVVSSQEDVATQISKISDGGKNFGEALRSSDAQKASDQLKSLADKGDANTLLEGVRYAFLKKVQDAGITDPQDKRMNEFQTQVRDALDKGIVKAVEDGYDKDKLAAVLGNAQKAEDGGN